MADGLHKCRTVRWSPAAARSRKLSFNSAAAEAALLCESTRRLSTASTQLIAASECLGTVLMTAGMMSSKEVAMFVLSSARRKFQNRLGLSWQVLKSGVSAESDKSLGGAPNVMQSRCPKDEPSSCIELQRCHLHEQRFISLRCRIGLGFFVGYSIRCTMQDD